MSLSYWNESESKNQVECDICIVGAGISGWSVAYWLKKEDPSLKVVVVDKSHAGAGATGRNAGFITCGSVEHFNRMVSKHGEEQATEIWRFAEDNMEMLQSEILSHSKESIDFKQSGAFSLAASSAEFNELQQVGQLMSQKKIPVETLNQQQVESRLGAQGFVGGIKYIKDGEVHPIKLLNLIKKDSDVQFIEDNEISSIEVDSDSRVLVGRSVNIKCTMVVLALNGYSVTLNPWFEDKIYPTRGQILMMEPVANFMEGPCYANFYLDYFRQLANGALLIGGFRQLQSDSEKGFSDHTSETIQQALHEFVKKHLPKVANKKVTHRWSGVMGFSQDGEPMIGSLPSDPQCFFLGGFTGHGLGLSFHVAKKLVDLMFDRKVPDWLSSRRF